MTTLYLVRHGPTHAKAMVGWSDVPADLSDSARITALSDYLPQDARIVSSDLCRTRDTATALAAPGRARLPDEPALREINFGDWELKPFSEIDKSHANLSRCFWTNPGDVEAPGGESWNQMAARVGPALDRLTAEGGDLIVVVHFAVILSQVARHLQLPPAEVLHHQVAPLSVTRIAFLPEGPRLGPINLEPVDQLS